MDIQNCSYLQRICNDTFQQANSNEEDVALAVEICYEILNENQACDSDDDNEPKGAITGATRRFDLFVFKYCR